MSDDVVTIRVELNLMSDDVWVLIPPKFWGKEGLAEGIKKVVEFTEEKDDDRPKT